jgi:hypothetical protein
MLFMQKFKIPNISFSVSRRKGYIYLYVNYIFFSGLAMCEKNIYGHSFTKSPNEDEFIWKNASEIVIPNERINLRSQSLTIKYAVRLKNSSNFIPVIIQCSGKCEEINTCNKPIFKLGCSPSAKCQREAFYGAVKMQNISEASSWVNSQKNQ